MTFGNRLAQLREEQGFHTRKSFAEKIGIPETTLRNYETDVREPGHTFLKQMSDFFKVSTDYLLGITEEKERRSTHQLKSSEFEHIEKYRSLDIIGQSHVNSILDWEIERIKQYQTTKKPLESPTATIIEIQPRPVTNVRLTEYFHSASAGAGIFILGNESTEKISVPATPENEIVDYVIKVSGNSMEPDYHDGDNVMVSQKLEMNYGDVGIFVVNGNAYIKEYGETELISRNPDAGNIRISEYDNIVCMGKVVGKLEGPYEIISD